MCAVSSVPSSEDRKFTRNLAKGENKGYSAATMDTRKLLSQLNDLIAQIEQIKADISAKYETPEMRQAIERNEKGLCCLCGEPHGDDVIYRGDHQKCYKRVHRSIQAKEITEDQAIRRGWFLPPERGGRKVDASDPIGQYLAEKEANPKPRKKRS